MKFGAGMLLPVIFLIAQVENEVVLIEEERLIEDPFLVSNILKGNLDVSGITIGL